MVVKRLVGFFLILIFLFSGSGLRAEKTAVEGKPQEVTKPAETAKKPEEPARSTVIMKVIAANPSRQKSQSVEVKSYLPIEIKPVNVINSGGLEVLFDKEKSCYYLYKKEVVLEPARIQPFTVELQDVWFIPQKDIDTLKTQTNELLDKVKKISYNYEEGKVVAEKILKKLGEISKSQEKDETLSLKTKIFLYRKNKDGLKEVRENLEKLRNLTKEKKEKVEDKKKKT
ncbi:MAG: hypothetical protein V2A65_04895 [Candidatus Omnitrophota bacterium]